MIARLQTHTTLVSPFVLQKTPPPARRWKKQPKPVYNGKTSTVRA